VRTRAKGYRQVDCWPRWPTASPRS